MQNAGVATRNKYVPPHMRRPMGRLENHIRPSGSSTIGMVNNRKTNRNQPVSTNSASSANQEPQFIIEIILPKFPNRNSSHSHKKNKDVSIDMNPDPPLSKKGRRKLIDSAKNCVNIPLLYGSIDGRRGEPEAVAELLADARNLLNSCKHDLQIQRLNHICADYGWNAEDCAFCYNKGSSFLEHVLSQSHIDKMIQSKIFPILHHLELIIVTLNVFLSSETSEILNVQCFKGSLPLSTAQDLDDSRVRKAQTFHETDYIMHCSPYAKDNEAACSLFRFIGLRNSEYDRKSSLSNPTYRLPFFNPSAVVEHPINFTDMAVHERIAVIRGSTNYKFAAFARLLETKFYDFFQKLSDDGCFIGCQFCKISFNNWYLVVEHALSRRHITRVAGSGHQLSTIDFELISSVYQEVTRKKDQANEHFTPVNVVLNNDIASLDECNTPTDSNMLGSGDSIRIMKGYLEKSELYSDSFGIDCVRQCLGMLGPSSKDILFANMSEKFWTTPLLSGVFRKPKEFDRITCLLATARIQLEHCTRGSAMERLNQICEESGWATSECVFCPQDLTSSFVQHVLSEDHLDKMLQEGMFPMMRHLRSIISALDLALYYQVHGDRQLPLIYGTADTEKLISNSLLLPTLCFQRSAVFSFSESVVEAVLQSEYELPMHSICPWCRLVVVPCDWIIHLTSNWHLNEMGKMFRYASIWDLNAIQRFIKKCEIRSALLGSYELSVHPIMLTLDDDASDHANTDIEENECDNWLNHTVKRSRKLADLGTRPLLYKRSPIQMKEENMSEEAVAREAEENKKCSTVKGNKRKRKTILNMKLSSASKTQEARDTLATEKKCITAYLYQSMHQLSFFNSTGSLEEPIHIDPYLQYYVHTVRASYLGCYAKFVKDLGEKAPKVLQSAFESGIPITCEVCNASFNTWRILVHHLLSPPHIRLIQQINLENQFPACPNLMDFFPRTRNNVQDNDHSSSESSSDDNLQSEWSAETVVANDSTTAIRSTKCLLRSSRQLRKSPLLSGCLRNSNCYDASTTKLLTKCCDLLKDRQNSLDQIDTRCSQNGWKASDCVFCPSSSTSCSYIQHVLSTEHFDMMMRLSISPIKKDFKRIAEVIRSVKNRQDTLSVKEFRNFRHIPLFFGTLKERHFMGEDEMQKLVSKARGLVQWIDSQFKKKLRDRLAKPRFGNGRCTICHCSLRETSKLLPGESAHPKRNMTMCVICQRSPGSKWLREICVHHGWNAERCAICQCTLRGTAIHHVLKTSHLEKMIQKGIFPLQDDFMRIIEALNGSR